jgi:hypothetical protein
LEKIPCSVPTPKYYLSFEFSSDIKCRYIIKKNLGMVFLGKRIIER